MMHRRQDLWGDDALSFRPERWEQRFPAWQFLPFLGGPRICLGQQFALVEASFLLVRLLHEFDAIEPTDPDMAKMRKGVALTMCQRQPNNSLIQSSPCLLTLFPGPRDGVKCRFRRASPLL